MLKSVLSFIVVLHNVFKSTGFLNCKNVSFKGCTPKFNHKSSSWTESSPSPSPVNDPQQCLNPLSGRMINQQCGLKNKKSRWFQFMYEDGGYIAYKSSLVALKLENLIVWEREEITGTKFSAVASEAKHEDPDNSWSHISPSIKDMDQYEDSTTVESIPCLDQILFVDKPPNLLTLPGKYEPRCLAKYVNEWLSSGGDDETKYNQILLKKAERSVKFRDKKKKSKKKKIFEPRPCHRLDRDTSGVMVIALTSDAIRTTSAMFENRFIEKQYCALVAGHLENDRGFVDYAIGKVYDPEIGQNTFRCHIASSILRSITKHVETIQYVSCPDARQFIENSLRNAKTEWRVSKRFTIELDDGTLAKYTRVHLKPHTGRGHQLRLHMAALGHPILGDTLHAPPIIASVAKRLCLHAESLEINAEIYVDGKTKIGRVVAKSVPPY